MTVDREQVRRDAEFQLERSHGGGVHRESSETILALLVELEQAERKMREARSRADFFERRYEEQHRIVHRLEDRVEQAEREYRQIVEEAWQERDALLARSVQAERERDANLEWAQAAKRDWERAESRLAAVPDLVEAAHKVADEAPASWELDELRDALAAYEQAQEQR